MDIKGSDRYTAEGLIKQAIKRYNNSLAVACSFGKDSMAILSMAIKYNPHITIIFENTGVQFPETYRFRDKIKKDWNLNLYETKPIKSFWQCVKEYGLPASRKQGGKGSNAPKCCYYLKEKPALILQRQLGIKAIITGLQACESRARKLLALRYDNAKAPYMEYDEIPFCSQRWFTRSTGIWNFHPIMNWSIQDIWDYTNENNLPVNPVYTKWGGIYPRSGCLPCTAYKSWKKRLGISHPKLLVHLIKHEQINKTTPKEKNN